MKITKVDGEAFSVYLLRRRIQAASRAPIRLTVRSEAGEVEEMSIDYKGGLRFPHLKLR